MPMGCGQRWMSRELKEWGEVASRDGNFQG